MIGFYAPGVPSADQTMYYFRTPTPFSLPANLLGSYVNAISAATASAVFDVLKNGVSIGSITFAASGTAATFSTAATSFAAGDFFQISAPTIADDTLADISFGLLGTRP
jgi:hypothetical protein